MLSTQLSTSLAAFGVLFLLLVAVFSAWVSHRATKLAKEAIVYSQSVVDFVNKKEPTSRIAQVEADMLELTDSHASLEASIKKLRSRVGMREVRARRKNAADALSDTPPSDDAGKAAYKEALREEARKRGLLR